MGASTGFHDLKVLVQSFHPVIVIETLEEERVRALLDQVAKELEIKYLEWSITRGLSPGPQTRGISVTMEPEKLLRHLEHFGSEGIFLLKDFAVHLREPTLARMFREVAQQFSRKRSTIVLTGVSVRLPEEIEHKVVHFELALPRQEELSKVVKSVLRSLSEQRSIELELTPQEYQELLQALSGLTINQARQLIAYAVLEDGKLSARDLETVLGRKAQLIRDGGLLECFFVESNHYQLGGFGALKAWLSRAAVGFTTKARELNLQPPRGILIVGVQGCGKSLAAKVISREWRRPLLKLDAGRLFDKYVGESEKNLRKAISLAEAMAPAVLWIDEIEKVMTAGSSDADGGVSRRLFGAFLTWLQEKRRDVFVVATANELSALPPELLRKGRFDEIFFVDLPDTDERRAILRIHLELRKQDPDRFDLEQLAAAADGFSGAELEQVVVSSLYESLHARRPLDDALLESQVRQLIPLSVSRKETISALRETARGRFAGVR